MHSFTVLYIEREAKKGFRTRGRDRTRLALAGVRVKLVNESDESTV